MTLPEAFLTHCREIMGETLFTQLERGLSSTPTASIRLNPCKSDDRAVNPVLSPRQVAWCPRGVYLGERPNFTFDPLLHAGAYYVQEASSMFVDEVLRQTVHQPITALDLCAAPGGKTTTLLSALPEGSVVVCNEYIRQRAHILAENIAKWGHPHVVVTNNSTSDIRRCGVEFDLILADVPCSGEGMFRKDEGAIAEWSEQNVRHCSLLQREILEDAWACLRPGGWLVYSTCTLNIHENEENIAWAIHHLGAQLQEVETPASWGITGSLGPTLKGKVCRFIPGVSEGEGLFMALLQKPSDRLSTKEKHKNKRQRQQPGLPEEVRGWLTDSNSYTIRQYGNTLTAVPQQWAALYDSLSSLRIIHGGVPLGTRRGRDLLPSAALALSNMLRRDAFGQYDADYTTAIAYLRNEAITLPSDTPRGIVLVTYHDMPLGFVKNIGNRANNLYPQEWRIRSSHAPEKHDEILIRKNHNA
ncbi:MAG: hypothetical protein J5637_02545 [Prevotella sp.]|nr:hypothetical protein [Prevotella sp.]